MRIRGKKIKLGKASRRNGDRPRFCHATHTLDRAHIEGVLTAKIAWMSSFHLTMGDIVVLLLLKGRNMRFGQHFSRLGDMTLECRQTLLE